MIYNVHNRARDQVCLIPHLNGLGDKLGGRLPKKIIADAAYGSEENYAYLEKHRVENFLKYDTFYKETHHYRGLEVLQAYQFRAENFGYDSDADQFICPANRCSHFQYISRYTTDNGYVITGVNYTCHDCTACSLRSRRTKGNHSIRVSFQLLEYRKQARNNLTSPKGGRLRAARLTEEDTAFGQIKYNLGFYRFHLRGLEKVNADWGLVSMAHNMQKLTA